jgi:hypothetical protein
MDLVDLIEESGAMGCEDAGESGRETRTNDDRGPQRPGLSIKCQQPTNIAEIVGDRDDRCTTGKQRRSLFGMHPGPTGEHHDINIERGSEPGCINP